MTDRPTLEQLLNTEHDITWGQPQQLSGLVRRITANNPSKFTFKGTGTYIVGRGKVAVIDPGPADSEHIQAVLRAVKGEEVSHIFITHTHIDHSPGTAELAETTGAATYGFGAHPADPVDYPYFFETGGIPDGDSGTADTEKSGDTHFKPQETVSHGDIIEGDGWTLECLHTPGHISNHICFALPQEQALFTGDHIMGWSSTIIPPPHGSLASYLDSLRLLLPRDDRTYYPTHGPAIERARARSQPSHSPQDFVQAILRHRQERTDQILHCLKSGPQTIAELVAKMYADKPKQLHKPAAQSVLAHLIYLLETDQIRAPAPADTTAAQPFTLPR